MQMQVVLFYSDYYVNHHRKSTTSFAFNYTRMRDGSLVSNNDLLKSDFPIRAYFHHTLECKMWCLSFIADAFKSSNLMTSQQQLGCNITRSKCVDIDVTCVYFCYQMFIF